MLRGYNGFKSRLCKFPQMLHFTCMACGNGLTGGFVGARQKCIEYTCTVSIHNPIYIYIHLFLYQTHGVPYVMLHF